MITGLNSTPFFYVEIFQSNLFPKFSIVLDLFRLILSPCRNLSVEIIHVEIILKVHSKKSLSRDLCCRKISHFHLLNLKYVEKFRLSKFIRLFWCRPIYKSDCRNFSASCFMICSKISTVEIYLYLQSRMRFNFDCRKNSENYVEKILSKKLAVEVIHSK